MDRLLKTIMSTNFRQCAEQTIFISAYRIISRAETLFSNESLHCTVNHVFIPFRFVQNAPLQVAFSKLNIFINFKSMARGHIHFLSFEIA